MTSEFYDKAGAQWAQEANLSPETYKYRALNFLQKIYAIKVKPLIESSPAGLPATFVEIGGHTNLSIIPALTRFHDTHQIRPDVILSDPEYRRIDIRQHLFKKILDKLDNVDPDIRAEAEARAAILEEKRETEAHQLLDNDIKITFDPRGFPNPLLPDGPTDYNLALMNVANYVAATDLQRLLSDRRIKSLLFINNLRFGSINLQEFIHPARIESSIDILHFLQEGKRSRYIPYISVIDNTDTVSVGTTIGGLLVRADSAEEAKWLNRRGSTFIYDPHYDLANVPMQKKNNPNDPDIPALKLAGYMEGFAEFNAIPKGT